jgi:hypothetical protein
MSLEMTPSQPHLYRIARPARSEPDHAVLTAADWPSSFVRTGHPAPPHLERLGFVAMKKPADRRRGGARAPLRGAAKGGLTFYWTPSRNCF